MDDMQDLMNRVLRLAAESWSAVRLPRQSWQVSGDDQHFLGDKNWPARASGRDAPGRRDQTERIRPDRLPDGVRPSQRSLMAIASSGDLLRWEEPGGPELPPTLGSPQSSL